MYNYVTKPLFGITKNKNVQWIKWGLIKNYF